MKFIHCSDTHLGFSDYYKIDPQTGINQREQDFYIAWQRLIDEVLQRQPDFVIHAGDLFHTTRPSNRAIAVALEGIQRISDAGIPFILISGNHSTPKIRATGSIFESIALFPGIHAAFQSQYEKYSICGGTVHCIPHCSLTEDLQAAFAAIQPDSHAQFQVLVAHGAWAGNSSFSMGEFNEQKLPNPEETTAVEFDYIALGHYHKHIRIKPQICYSGATERTSFNEADNTPGFVEVDLQTQQVDHFALPSRPMFKLGPLDCSELNSVQIYDELVKWSTDDLKEALVSLQLINIHHETLVKLDGREIDAIFPQVFHLQKSLSRQVGIAGTGPSQTEWGSVPIEFERYIQGVKDKELDKGRLRELGLSYLTKDY
ncbi:MAG: exonuclease SbcCD subunit D [candidate division KSB1 bacterium]|nr:exonuclease SbcCD subunit D [candidate division KSB1 bacterium]MDZ7318154.1 exonuclease SbcCD subunit D [candidate division KSB1 bacterium]MDZ7342393.1 exonuclease SbcCD subunit D [candidate division KSB1 bacterium]